METKNGAVSYAAGSFTTSNRKKGQVQKEVLRTLNVLHCTESFGRGSGKRDRSNKTTSVTSPEIDMDAQYVLRDVL